MKKHHLILLLLTLFFSTFIASPETHAQSPSAPHLSQSGVNGLALEWHLPAPRLEMIEVAGVWYSQAQIEGVPLVGQPGQPELPTYNRLIGLPTSGEASVKILVLETEILQMDLPPLPAATPQTIEASPQDITAGMFNGGGPLQRVTDPERYNSDTFWPTTPVQLGPPQQIRDQRVATLTINPIRVNPVSRKMEVVRFIQLEITFSQPAPGLLATQSERPADGFSQALTATLLNPEAGQWRTLAPGAVQAQAASTAASKATKVLVDEVGLYILSYSALQEAGLPVNVINPQTFQLSHGYPRQEVAILEQGDGDTIFEPGESLLFYAEPKFSRFVDYDVYFLTYGGANGWRMGSRNGTPTGPSGTAWRTAQAEVNQFYDPLYAGRDGDRWFWDKLFTPNKLNGSYSVLVDQPNPTGAAATLTVWLQGYTASRSHNPDHQVQIFFNNTHLGTVSWEGKTAYTATLSVPTHLLQAGSNQVDLVLPGIAGVVAEGVWLDALQLRYPTSQATSGQLYFQGDGAKQYTLSGWSGGGRRVFAVTAPQQPEQVNGYSYTGSSLTIGDADNSPASYVVVPTGQEKTPLALQASQTVNDPPGGGDYIIITPSSLAAAIAPLANHRTSRGLRVTTVEVEAIYDTYGTGRMDPEAIRTFLAHAYHNWVAPAPLYVLLVGDGSYDFKNYSGFNPVTMLPPYLAEVDPWWGETAADNRLVTIVGNDALPDMLIGRLAVTNSTETATIINKIIQYETNPPPGDWSSQQLFVSDNPDAASDFHADSDEGLTKMAGALNGQRFYYSEQSSSASYVYSSIPALQTDFLTALNEGASLITYHGHSSWHQWAVESLFHVDNVADLSNQGRLPVVLEMTCFTGFFHHPEYPTLDESLVRQTGGGAVAAWAGTGLGVGTGHRSLQTGFQQAVMQNGETILGAAALAGKMTLQASGIHQDLLDTYTLFGDPAMTLASVLKPDVVISQHLQENDPQPGDPVTLNITVENIGVGVAQNIQIMTTVPLAILNPGFSTDPANLNLTQQGNTYQWHHSALPSAQKLSIAITGQLDPSLPTDFAVINQVEVTTSSSEMDVTNNTHTFIIGGSRIFLPLINQS